MMDTWVQVVSKASHYRFQYLLTMIAEHHSLRTVLGKEVLLDV